jgi:CheY-like chemotaxis protein
MTRILVIDDEKDIRVVLKEVLKRAGYEVVTAANARMGLEAIDAGDVDLVITDIIMPGMDGVATVENIRRDHPDIRIIVISGGGNVAPLDYAPGAIATTAYLESARKAGADRTLTKPFSREDILEAVADLLSRD